MRMTPYVYYQEDDMGIGWLEEYPDYRTQGDSLEELEENLRDIQQELQSDAIPSPYRHSRAGGNPEGFGMFCFLEVSPYTAVKCQLPKTRANAGDTPLYP